MKLLKISLVLGFILCFNAIGVAATLEAKLNKINFDLDMAEILSSNCVLIAQEQKKFDRDCTEAEQVVQRLSKKIKNLSRRYLALQNDPKFNMNQLQQKIKQVYNQLSVAKSLTSDSPINTPYRK